MGGVVNLISKCFSLLNLDYTKCKLCLYEEIKRSSKNSFGGVVFMQNSGTESKISPFDLKRILDEKNKRDTEAIKNIFKPFIKINFLLTI